MNTGLRRRPYSFGYVVDRVSGSDMGSFYVDDKSKTWTYESNDSGAMRARTSAYGGTSTEWIEDSWRASLTPRERVNRRIDLLAGTLGAGEAAIKASKGGSKTTKPVASSWSSSSSPTKTAPAKTAPVSVPDAIVSVVWTTGTRRALVGLGAGAGAMLLGASVLPAALVAGSAYLVSRAIGWPR